MTLEEAFEILDLNVKEAGRKMPPDTLTALKIGIEASLEVQRLRILGDVLVVGKLPSETED